MQYDIEVGAYRLGMLESVKIHSSLELLSDTATVVLPDAESNARLDIEQKIKRGDSVRIRLGYTETGMVEEFRGYLLRVSTDGGNLTLHCEDDLYLYRKNLKNKVHQGITLKRLLEKVLSEAGITHKVDCSYSWTYEKFTIHTATAYDVLRKVQQECGADIYIKDGTLHIHPPGRYVGKERYYDFSANIEEADLLYRTAIDKRLKVTVKALLPDGKVRKVEVGATDGERVEVKCPTSDIRSMKERGEVELRRRTYDGYEGSIVGWLIPECKAGDSVTIKDLDYPHKDGAYLVISVTTEMSSEGGRREIRLGYKLS